MTLASITDAAAIPRRTALFFAALAITWSCHIAPLAAERLLDGDPYDLVTLTPAGGGVVIKVFPLDLPKRLAPTSIPTRGQIRVTLVDRPESLYLLAWSDVARVQTFEQLLLEEAVRLVDERQFDGAFDNLEYVHRSAPDTPGLAAVLERFLLENAAAEFSAGRPDAALGMLLELAARAPKDPNLPRALDTVADRIIDQYVASGQFPAARAILNLVAQRTPDQELTLETRWPARLQALADERLAQARAQWRGGNFLQARVALREAVDIWPGAAGAVELAGQIQRDGQLVVVGVTGKSLGQMSNRLSDWNGRRVERLLGRRLVELTGYSAQGATYRYPFGEVTHDPTGRTWTIQLQPRSAPSQAGAGDWLHGYDITPLFISAELRPPIEHIEVHDVYTVELEMSHPTLAAESFLQPLVRSPLAAPYAAAGEQPGEKTSPVTFKAGDQYTLGRPPKLLVEAPMQDNDRAVQSLVAGEIDVLDRVAPWNVRRLKSDSTVVVSRYALPTVHAILPISDHPLLRSREFRRALVYGIPRRRIVEEVLWPADERQGAAVVSGPFTRGEELNDPLAYAYDTLIEPRPYDPRLAAGLVAVARSAAAAALSADDDAPTLNQLGQPLVLGYPADPVVRELCRIIKQQLASLGVEISLVEIDAATPPSELQGIDLVYLELAMWEPVRNIQELLGAGGLAPRSGARLPAELVHLAGAGSWTEIRERLLAIHRIVHDDLPMIPLWQTTNYFAYRRGLAGIGERPLVLYQDVEDWNTQELQWLP